MIGRIFTNTPERTHWRRNIIEERNREIKNIAKLSIVYFQKSKKHYVRRRKINQMMVKRMLFLVMFYFGNYRTEKGIRIASEK